MTDQKAMSNDATDAEITLTIIICSYNTRVLVVDCLQSIYQNPPSLPFEIILVDDASTDGTSEAVRLKFPEVRLLRSEVNRHYTRSNNWALDHARGRYILLLNSDTVVLPQALDAMITFLKNTRTPAWSAASC